MTTVLTATTLLFGIATALLARYALRLRGEKRGDGVLRAWPIPQVELDAFDERFRAGPLGPSRASEVVFVGGYRVPGGVSDRETWILATLAKSARTVFEFGTCTGKTTYVLARNAPADARIVTLTLGPDQLAEYRDAQGDECDARDSAMQESQFETFYYSGTDVEAKIEQLFGDSKAFDETPYAGTCDLVFIDGSHAYSYVKNDTEKALRMLGPGGILLWHDYCGPRRAAGVFRRLNELARERPLVRLKGTTLVAYRHGD